MTVHVAILNWNAASLTLSCLENLGAVQGVDPIVHVVDNGSTDDSVLKFRSSRIPFELHCNAENLGFAGGINVALRAALNNGAEWIFLLNNDARMRPNALAELLKAAERRPECGLYTGKIYSDWDAGVLWSCGVTLGGWPNLCRLRGFRRKDRGQYDSESAMPLVTGCALLIHRKVFERVGLFDPAFFLYVEDADFCARAVKAGFKPLYVPSAVFEHVGSASSGGGYSTLRKYLNAHGAWRYLRRHGTASLWLTFLLLDVLAWPILFAVLAPTGRLPGVLAKGRGLVDGFLRRAPSLPPSLKASLIGEPRP